MKQLSDYEKTEVIKMYTSGKTIHFIAKQLKCRTATITSFLKENGYGRRKRNMLEGAESLKSSRKWYLILF